MSFHRRSSFPRGPSGPALTVSNYHHDERLNSATGVVLHLGWTCTTSVPQTPQQQRRRAEHQGQATLRQLWLAGRRPREVLPRVRTWGLKLLGLCYHSQDAWGEPRCHGTGRQELQTVRIHRWCFLWKGRRHRLFDCVSYHCACFSQALACPAHRCRTASFTARERRSLLSLVNSDSCDQSSP